jgi:hypothetical protein
VYGSDRQFSTAPPAFAFTQSATSSGPGQLTFSGVVNPKGSATTYYFEYGTGSGYGATTAVTSAGGGTTAVTVTASVNSLADGVAYHYQLVARNPSGITKGGDRFQVTPSAPSAWTQGATASGSGQLTLNGTVSPHGLTTTYSFQYGTSTSYGDATAVTIGGSGTRVFTVSAVVSGLTPGVVYHYQLVATNACGATPGGDHYLKAA